MSSIDAKPVRTIYRTVVIGATGRIGTLIRPFWQIQPVTWQSRQDLAGFETVDILSDRAALERLLRGAGAVLCLAGITPAPKADMRLNVTLARAVLDAAHATGTARVLLTSTGAVYGNGPGPHSEDGPTAPLSDYARSKLDMEAMAAAHAHSAHTTSLRVGNVAGADAILGKWQPGMRLDQLPDGRAPRRSYIGPQTLARVFGALAGARTLPPLLNIAAPGTTGMDDLLDAAGLPFSYRPPLPGVIPDVSLCTKRLETLVSFDPGDSMAKTMVTQWHNSKAVQ